MGVGRVAMEPAADLVVHPAGGHGVERHAHHVERLGSLVADEGAQQEVERHRLGELRRRPEPAELRVVLGPDRLVAAGEDLGRGRGPVARCAQAPSPLEHLRELSRLLEQVVPPAAPRLVDGLEHGDEPRHAVTLLLGEVRSAEERSAVGVDEHGHRPPAATGHCLHRLHVDAVDVGPFLAVDLHADDQAVHHRRHVRVLEALVRHDVAPVARRVADREEHRLVLGACLLERLVAPRVPVDGVVGVLAEIRARLAGEAIHLSPVAVSWRRRKLRLCGGGRQSRRHRRATSSRSWCRSWGRRNSSPPAA